MLGFLVDWLLQGLILVNSYFNNWAYTIIVFAFIIRTLVFPFYVLQTRQMKLMKSIQPEIDRIRVTSKDYKQDEGKLYMKKGINPLFSILVLFLQAFIFISLFVAFRSTTFLSMLKEDDLFLWWKLLENDKTYILPALNTAFIMLSGLKQSSSMAPIAVSGITFFISMNWNVALLIAMISVSLFTLIQDIFISVLKLDG